MPDQLNHEFWGRATGVRSVLTPRVIPMYRLVWKPLIWTRLLEDCETDVACFPPLPSLAHGGKFVVSCFIFISFIHQGL